MRFFIAAICAALLFVQIGPALAATSGIVRGTVTFDGQPRAHAQLSFGGEGSRFDTFSDANGTYVFSSVPFGHYRLTAHTEGAPDRTFDLDVSSDAVVKLDIAMSANLRTIAQTGVTARAGAGGTPVSQNALGRAQIGALPTNNSLNRLAETVPGIVRFSYDEPVAHGFHGLTYEIDGAPLPQATSSNFAEIIDPKNVDSLEIFTGAFPAEYGGSRQGAVINIITQRPSGTAPPPLGHFSIAAGSYALALTSFDDALRFGKTDLFLSANTQRSARGLDAPTFVPEHDNSSQADQFLRLVTHPNDRISLAFDFSNQLAQFQIPINTDPNNPNDPVVSVPGTDDVQREYDRYANLNLSVTSRDGNGIFQVIPWTRSTRIVYDGDLANDVLATQPDPVTGLPVNLIGLRQDRRATYAGIRISDFRSSAHHAWKIGIDASRENFIAHQQFAQFMMPDVFEDVSQAGAQIGIYAQDKWQPSPALAVSYGLRYDHSTGFVGGWQLSPRIGVNIAPDGKNIVHFYYGRLYAAPALEDVRQACVALSGCPSVPVYDLKPEQDSYFEMGVAHQFSPTLHGYINYFKRTAVNVLDTTQLLNTPLFAVFNNARGRAEGVELRLDGRTLRGDSWYFSGTVSSAEAAGVSGSTFLFPPGPSNDSFQPEDHDQTYAANAAYTHRFGRDAGWFATLQSEYGSGYPVQFQSGPDRLPTHLTFNVALGKEAKRGSFGFDVNVDNLLNHQYIIKMANGFNTTQISSGRKLFFRLTAPL
jgi:outer membrane receptor for ferrienterochelin and colicins